MFRKLIQGILVSSIIVIIPLAGNMAMVRAPHVWILVATGVLASLFQPPYNPFKRSPNSKDRGTATQIIWSIYITQLLVLVEAAYYRYPQSISWNILKGCALLLMAAGLIIRSWGVFTLGKYFTWHISVEADQKVITTGPYAFVRHPGYFGAFLTYWSTALFLNAWYSFILATIVLPFAFLRRIHYEEIELKNNLGEAYKSYSKKVKGFIPWVW